MEMISKLSDTGSKLGSKLGGIIEKNIFGKNENNKREVLGADNKTLMRMPTIKDVEKAREERLQGFKGKNVISSGDSELGTYDSNPIITSDLSIIERLEVNTSNHISNWKTDVFLGNGKEIVTKVINLNPKWNSLKSYLQISRIIVWIVPVAPNTCGKIKAALVDRNKEEGKKIIFEKEGILDGPLCFIFYMNWSYLKEENTEDKCPQLCFISDEVYKKGVRFAVVNFAWRKVFCNSPLCMTPMQPDLIILNRGITIRNTALLEAVKCLVPRGDNGATIKKQIETLSASLEEAAIQDEVDNYKTESSVTGMLKFDL